MKKEYLTTIGLEIHAELKTETKMFCNSKNDPDERNPNINICPVCMGYPGTLPVINKEAVKHILRMGIAVGGQIADFTEFDRKNYFYPDIPKGYQISQYKFPLIKGGVLRGVQLTRIHLEEDTARSSHDTGDFSLVDYNRACLPLMELVTEPVIHSAKEASSFAKELQLLLQCLGAGEANMEKGEMRVEANISVSSDESFGTKVEVKNLNSFRSVEKAIEYEVARHIEAIENGDKVTQETRGWDEKKEITFSQRLKEESHDYRYFPEPDLPKLFIKEIPEFSEENLKSVMPELPWEKRERYINVIELKESDAEVFVVNSEWSVYFEEVSDHLKNDKKLTILASNYIISDLLGLVGKEGEFWSKKPIGSDDFAALIKMVGDEKITSRTAKDILAIMYREGGKPEQIAEAKGLLQKSDESELKKIIEEIINSNPKVVEDYKGGKEASLQFLIGQGMKATKGSANPKILSDLFKSRLQ
ncbi:MAG: glutaminyl-tRNA synthase (glutamine-hydrolyzing) subunit B [Candidatus Taylorbacteria bacterium RIFCSPLOWO2_02_FULL_43_22b]|nr:MAG: glutaminyl-tRNA synthase (glutamine-hydrolyzing) subunit B [Candidatus Taylorbacteria bacterium RIFCSPLOWO2_02_FULL_43_22b]